MTKLQVQNTHVTHNHFTALLDFVRDYPDEPTPESRVPTGPEKS